MHIDNDLAGALNKLVEVIFNAESTFSNILHVDKGQYTISNLLHHSPARGLGMTVDDCGNSGSMPTQSREWGRQPASGDLNHRSFEVNERSLCQ